MNPDLAATFRDPAGSVLVRQGRVLRFLRPAGMSDFTAIWDSPMVQRELMSGRLPRTERIDPSRDPLLSGDPEIRELITDLDVQAVLEHEKIPFQSFPYEWPPEMLHAAAALTIDLAEAFLDEGLGFKDATPYNVLFRGPTPVFVDLLSIEKRVPDDPIWLPYAQFIRTFLLPLLANRHFGLGLDQILTTRRDGLEPEEVYRWLSPVRKFCPPFLTLVSLPSILAARQNPGETGVYARRSAGSEEKARFILRSQFRRLRSLLSRLEPKAAAKSTWSGYMQTNSHYSSEEFAAKEKFVAEALAEFSPRAVLDAGCNTGHFSAIAARQGARVVAIDYDPVVVGQVWRRARLENLDILPLAVNLTRPTPSLGWRNQECASFLDRARGGFDAVVMLAVIHHMLVTERVPLNEIVDLAAQLTTNFLIIEFVAPEDPMFQRLLRGRGDLHRGLDHNVFETVCRRRFEIVRAQHQDGSTRWLYVLKKRA